MTAHTLETPSPLLTRSMVRISADQYHKMIEQGIIPEDASTELLDGIIVHKDRSDNREDPMGPGPGHRLAVRLLTRLAARIDSDRCHLQIQVPISLGEAQEPEPDGAVIRGTDREYADHLPESKDVSCVIEVAHSSLERDSQEKLVTYALAGIPQYVIINLRDVCVEVHERPLVNGTYGEKVTLTGQERVRFRLVNGETLEIAAAELLP